MFVSESYSGCLVVAPLHLWSSTYGSAEASPSPSARLPLQDNMPQTPPPLTGQLTCSGYNKNLYQPKEEGYPGLFYHDNNLVSGSLEALIHHLVPTVDYYPDVSGF